MWGIKWVIADLVCDMNTISKAIEKVLFYTKESETLVVSYADALKRNLQYIGKALKILFITTICTYVFDFKRIKNEWKSIIIYLMIAAVPVIWILVVKNQSYIHVRFTFRNLYVIILALLFMIADNLNRNRKEKERS